MVKKVSCNTFVILQTLNHLFSQLPIYTSFENASAFDMSKISGQPIAQAHLNLPGSVVFSAQRYALQSNFDFESKASIVYQVLNKSKGEKQLQLSFCTEGKIYCNQSVRRCGDCQINSLGCDNTFNTVDILQLQFSEKYLQQFLKVDEKASCFLKEFAGKNTEQIFDDNFTITSKVKTGITALLGHTYEGTMANIFVNAQLQMILLYSLESHFTNDEEPVFVCKFLANEDDRKKILAARDVLIKNINTPITIKQLSRKVGINECYLKKGFKEVFGSTIFEFYQTQRMEHAKYLLYEKGLTVTEVSELLNYSSISHFSTAFKKQTGIKPCELLNR